MTAKHTFDSRTRPSVIGPVEQGRLNVVSGSPSNAQDAF
jgi:hypothetical protein